MNPDLRRRVAQLLVIRASGHLSDGQRRYPRWELPNQALQSLLQEGVGGVILLGGSAAELRLRTLQLQAWSDTPLLLCADVEEGVGQRFEGASWLVPPLALAGLHREDPARALELAHRYGSCTGREARALGLNWVLGPVCDVNNNPANPVINVRAWGEDPDTAGALACAFLRSAQAQGVLCCAKHFPGPGDSPPQTPMTTGVNLIRLDQPLASPFLPAAAPALSRPAAAGFHTCLITAQSPSPWSDDPRTPLDLERLGEGPVLLQLFVRGNPFRGSAGGGEEPWEAVIAQLQSAGRLAGLAVYGSPYLWRRLRTLLQADIPAAYSPAQMPLAQEVVLAALGLGSAPALSGSAQSAMTARTATAERTTHAAEATVATGSAAGGATAQPRADRAGFTD